MATNEVMRRLVGMRLQVKYHKLKILDVGYWWSTMNRDVHKYCQTCDQCQRTSNLLKQNLKKLVAILPKEPFQKWDWIILDLLNLQVDYQATNTF
jgi:hypothetical protein